MNSPLTTAPKPFCFVLMPFDDEFNDVYQIGIKEACDLAGAYCERVDEQVYEERILDRIYNQIAKADVVIADMTGRNPNVFYEVGYAHALDKPTILLTQKTDDIPFDLKHFFHLVYENKLVVLRDQLSHRVRWYVENPRKTSREGLIDVQLFYNDQDLDTKQVVHQFAAGTAPVIHLLIHNCSFNVHEQGDLEVGVITSIRLDHSSAWNIYNLPEGRLFHSMQPFVKLLPQSYVACEFFLESRTRPMEVGYSEDIVVRISTRTSVRDFTITLLAT